MPFAYTNVVWFDLVDWKEVMPYGLTV